MEDLIDLTFKELWKLNWNVDMEMLKRVWWIYPVFFVIYAGVIIYKYEAGKENETR